MQENPTGGNVSKHWIQSLIAFMPMIKPSYSPPRVFSVQSGLLFNGTPDWISISDLQSVPMRVPPITRPHLAIHLTPVSSRMNPLHSAAAQSVGPPVPQRREERFHPSQLGWNQSSLSSGSLNKTVIQTRDQNCLRGQTKPVRRCTAQCKKLQTAARECCSGVSSRGSDRCVVQL